MKFKIRCPQCTKLYEVNSEDIKNETPLFQCISCEVHFSFEYPPKDSHNILCFPISSDDEVAPNAQIANVNQDSLTESEKVLNAQSQSESLQQPVSQEMKSCPKCGALNGRASRECYSCHVIFEKLEGLPTDPSLKAQPSLVRKWKNLVENFENEDLHHEFLRSCHQLDALKFAIYKYEELKKAQGGDPQCDIMIARANTLMLTGLTKDSFQPQVEKKPKWQKYLYWGPFGFSALLVLAGMLNLAQRNLIGVGVALACMTVGLILMIKGRIKLSDFVD